MRDEVLAFSVRVRCGSCGRAVVLREDKKKCICGRWLCVDVLLPVIRPTALNTTGRGG